MNMDNNPHNEIERNPELNFLNKILDNNRNNEYVIESPYNLTHFDCSYITENSYINLNHSATDFNVLSLNIQSLSSKYDAFKTFIYKLINSGCGPDVICIQETWQINSETEFNIEGYQPLVYKIRDGGVQGGGVGIFVKNGLSFKINPNYSIFQDRVFESLFIDIKVSNAKTITIGSCYRPNIHPYLSGKDQSDLFLELFSNLCSLLPSNSYIFGDFNLNLLCHNTVKQVSDYMDTLFSYGFLQHIIYPTRVSLASATLIDHVLSNHLSQTSKSFILTTDISDHYPIIFSTNYIASKKPKKQILRQNFSKNRLIEFGNALKNISWNDTLTSLDSNTAYDTFEDTFKDLYNIYFPFLPYKPNRNHTPIESWMSPGLLISRNTKIKLFQISRSSPTIYNIQKYKTYRNLFNTVVRSAKKIHYEEMFSKNIFNLKQTWILFNKAINKKPKKREQNISEIKFQDLLLKDPAEIANCFNNFYLSIATDIVRAINPPPPNPDPEIAVNPNSTFELHSNPVTYDEIFTTMKKLQKKRTADINGISVNFISNFILTLSKPLKHIFNLSLSTSVFPNKLKIAKITPIFKAGDPLLTTNYRPISILNVFSKILEKIVHTRLSTFLENNNLINPRQFGFRADHSTSHPLSLVTDTLVKAIDKKQHSIAIFCDLSKAFDCVDHKLLLKKLRGVGVGGGAVE